MLRRATTYIILLTGVLLVGTAQAQVPVDVTLRQINEIAQANIDALNAAGSDLVAGDITSTQEGCDGFLYDFTGSICGALVRFTAVVMSDPLNSGLATPDDETGQPTRVHVFVRDVNADTDGPLGMGGQIVDASGLGSKLLLKGDVITVTANVSHFFKTLQLDPVTIELTGEIRDLETDPIFDPIAVSTSDINMSIGPDGAVQVNWDNISDYRANFVRFEGVTVMNRDFANDRPNIRFSSDGGTTSVNTYETSLRYRNDRSNYNPEFNVRDDDYIPPAIGASINIQGFLTYPGVAGSDPFSFAVPFGTLLALNPMEDSDLVVVESPPSVTDIGRPTGVPGANPIAISADVTPDPTRTITGVVLKYFLSSDATTTLTLNETSSSGLTHNFLIPPAPDGDFVTYWIEATDSESAVTVSASLNYRVLLNGLDDISDIQLTINSGEGPSPFDDVSDFMNIQATVTTSEDVSGFLAVQDGTGPWSGIVLERTDELNALDLLPGDVINILGGTVREIRGPDRFDRSGDVTGIEDPTIGVVSRGGTPMPYLAMTTDVLQDEDVAEGFESMILRFDNVTVITPQADAPNDFGEFRIGSAGDDVGVRVDDQSDSFSSSFNDGLNVGDNMAFIQGLWSDTFGNMKLMPESLDDVGVITDTEENELPGQFVLHQNFPNPFNPTTSIRFDIARTGHVKLEVFDIIGRRVMTLVDGERSVGVHIVSFDARRLSSGVYMYRMVSGSNVHTKRMLLLK